MIMDYFLVISLSSFVFPVVTALHAFNSFKSSNLTCGGVIKCASAVSNSSLGTALLFATWHMISPAYPC